MAWLLRALLFFMFTAIGLTVASAHGLHLTQFSHIQLAIPSFIFLMFVQAFVMFYFIGTSRLVNNVDEILKSPQNLHELFETPPKDLSPYLKKVQRFVLESTLSKRQTIPWTILMLILGTLGFLLGAAHDTHLVPKVVHSGVVYGFLAAMLIGFFRQWYYLGKSHVLLRELKELFGISSDSM